MPPLVSVVMPSYNHERYISESIESVLNQSIADLELIIIDDASSDRSRQIIEACAKKDGRIKAVFHERNMGIARTMNDGIEQATGKFISFTASDDLWVKEKLDKQLRVLQEDEDLVVWADAEIIDAEGNLTGRIFSQEAGLADRKPSGDIFHELLSGNFVNDKLLKRQNLGDIRFNEDLRYLNDYQFNVDLARRHRYHFLPESLVRYRVHGANTIKDVLGYAKDNVIIGRYFLSEYGGEISREQKRQLYWNMANDYLKLRSEAQMWKCLCLASWCRPFDFANFAYLAFGLSNRHPLASRILRPPYQLLRVILHLRRDSSKVLQDQ